VTDGPETGGQPSLWARADAWVYAVERLVVGGLFVAMAVAVFVDVVHRIFSRSPGRLASILAGIFGADARELDGTAAPIIMGVVFALLAYGAVRTRARAKGDALGLRQAVGRALVLAVGLTVIVQTFLWLMPEGIVWAPYGALVTLLWVGLIGASMATHTGKHLALEMGEKLWPERAQSYVRRVSQLITALFSLLLVLLGSISLEDHLSAWLHSPQAALIPAVDWPKWIVFAVVPYAFGMIALRMLGRVFRVLAEPTPPEVPT
jgi:TRAP-type C4-dicarboxylate transport system permease small subunit